MSKHKRKQYPSDKGAPATSRVVGSSSTSTMNTQVSMEAGNDGFSSPGFLLMGGGFQAAGMSPNRGYLYWPTTDTRRQITSLTREEIARRIQWLYAHFGFARKLVMAMSRMLGFQTPQPNTSDELWNEEAFEVFHSIAGSAEIWDRQGRFDFFEGQIQDNISGFRDGDGLAVLTSTPSGRARMAYYEAHQIVNGDRTGDRWVDGVQVSAGGRHMGYNVRDGEDTGKYTFVDARDAIYFGNFENRGQVRPLSVLHAAVLNMWDVVETRGFMKTKLKNSARQGHVVETDQGTVQNAGAGGMGGPAIKVPMTMPDGTVQDVNMEVVYGGGIAPKLAPGQKLKVVSDQNPSANHMDFERALLRDCCDAVDLSYDRLCNITGITGPGIRILNADEKRWVLLRHYRMAKRNQRQYNYCIAKELKAGRLREPVLKPGEYWWNRCQWIGLPIHGIDAGHTAQGILVELQSGQTTWLDLWGQKGVYWKRGVRQAVAEVIFAKMECALQSKATGVEVTAQEVFPQRFASYTFAEAAALAATQAENIKPGTEPTDADDPPENAD